jgi:hypothetical protein
MVNHLHSYMDQLQNFEGICIHRNIFDRHENAIQVWGKTSGEKKRRLFLVQNNETMTKKKYCTGYWMPTFFRQPFRSNICYRTIINIHPGIFILISYDGPKVVFEMEDVMGPIASSSRLTRQEWSMKVIYHFGEATYLQSVILVERQACFFSVFIRTILTHKPRTNQN